MATIGEILSDATGQGWEPGDLKTTARSTPSAGWLVCDGSLVSTTTYANLFAAIAHAYNGGADPGGGNFKLPDYRDKVIVGVSGTKVRGATGGAENVTLTAAESGLPAHSHTYTAPGTFGTLLLTSGTTFHQGAATSAENAAAPASQAHNNMQPYQTAHIHIKI